MKTTTIRIPVSLRDELKKQAKTEKRTLAGLVELILEEYLNAKNLPK